MIRAAALAVMLSLIATAAVGQTDDGLRRDGARPMEAPAEGATDVQTQDAPLLRVQFDETEAIPGQALSLRLTVLVPTSLTKPPVWPALEAPNLLVRLPERSTGPTSETINGTTWSGVTRHYRLSPMAPGTFQIPPQEIAVEWRNPDGGAPLSAAPMTEALTFTGVVPDGAEGLDPFFAAHGFALTQEIEGTPDAMVPGDSVSLTLTATVEGTSPMFIPPLLAVPSLAGLKSYPEDPTLVETETRGVPGGTRTERITFVAEGGGTGTIPGTALDWYNVSTGSVDRASTEDIVFSIDGPRATPSQPPRDPREVILMAALSLVVLALLAVSLRILMPRFRRAIQTRKEVWQRSERYAWRQVIRAVSDQDMHRLHVALDSWAKTADAPDPASDARVLKAMTALGRARFASQSDASTDRQWHDLRRALETLRTASRRSTHTSPLPPLNPTSR